jgi:hypothetical protein
MSYKTYLRRRAAAEYMREQRRIPCSEKTLAKLACIGGGPVYPLFGPIPLYASLTSTPTPTPSSAGRSARPPNTGTNDEPGQITCHQALRVRPRCLRQQFARRLRRSPDVQDIATKTHSSMVRLPTSSFWRVKTLMSLKNSEPRCMKNGTLRDLLKSIR